MVNDTRAGARALASFACTLGLAATLAAPGSAVAQDVTGYAVGAADGDETNLQLIGVSVRPDGYGWKPVGSLQVYRLGYPIGTETVDVWSVTPAVGVGYRAPTGSIEAKLGYAFQTDDGADVLFFEGGEGGPKTSLQAIYWGGEPELQAQASYGWRDESLYSQAQATYAILNLNPGEIGLGAEAVWQGSLESSDEYRSTQFGPVVRWVSGNGMIAALSSGLKDSNFTDDTWYVKLVLVLSQ